MSHYFHGSPVGDMSALPAAGVAVERELHGGQQRVYRFANGFGASVVNSSMVTNGAPFELAVLRFKSDDDLDFVLSYSTTITSDVERANADEVVDMLKRIEALAPAGGVS